MWPFSSEPCEYEYDCGECSATCGEDAVKMCSIRIIQEARYGGKKCPIGTITRTCGLDPCTGPVTGVQLTN